MATGLPAAQEEFCVILPVAMPETLAFAEDDEVKVLGGRREKDSGVGGGESALQY